MVFTLSANSSQPLWVISDLVESPLRRLLQEYSDILPGYDFQVNEVQRHGQCVGLYYISILVGMCLRMYVPVCMGAFVYVYICAYMCIRIYARVYICCICMYKCVCMYGHHGSTLYYKIAISQIIKMQLICFAITCTSSGSPSSVSFHCYIYMALCRWAEVAWSQLGNDWCSLILWARALLVSPMYA